MEEGSAGRKASLVLVSNLAGAGLGYAALLLIGRYFAPDSYGSYLFALSLAGVIAVVSNLGLGLAHQRQVAAGLEPRRAFGVLVRLRLAIAVPALGLGVAAYLVWSALKGPAAVTDATAPAVLGVALAVQLVSAARQAIFDTWQGLQRVHRIELAKTLDTVLSVLFIGNAALLVASLQGRSSILPAVGAFWADRLGLAAQPTLTQGALLLAGSYAAAKALSFLVCLGWWAADRVGIGPWDRDLARAYLRFATPLALAGSLALVLQYTDIVMLGFFWTDYEVGLYGAAQRLSTVCLLGAFAVGTVLFPRFAQLRAKGDATAERATFLKAERFLLILVAPLAAAMVALPREGLHVAVGDAYLDAAAPLRFLALWALFGALEQPITARLLAAGRTKVMVRSAAINAGGNVLLNLLFIPPQALGLGPAGAALATLLSTVAAYVYMRWEGRKAYGVPFVGSHQARILTAGALVGVGWWLLPSAVGSGALDRVYELLGWGVAGLLVYAGALAVLGELRRRDLEFLRQVTHPRALLAELRGR